MGKPVGSALTRWLLAGLGWGERASGVKGKLRIGQQKLQPRTSGPRWHSCLGGAWWGGAEGFRLEASLAQAQGRTMPVLQCVPGGLDTVVFSWWPGEEGGARRR